MGLTSCTVACSAPGWTCVAVSKRECEVYCAIGWVVLAVRGKELAAYWCVIERVESAQS